jgi:hypothetical protein
MSELGLKTVFSVVLPFFTGRVVEGIIKSE